VWSGASVSSWTGYVQLWYTEASLQGLYSVIMSTKHTQYSIILIHMYTNIHNQSSHMFWFSRNNYNFENLS